MKKEEQKKVFYYVNLDHLQKEIAKGQGENLRTFLALSGCDHDSHLSLRKQLKENFEAIFSKDIESYLKISPIVDSYCKGEIEKT